MACAADVSGHLGFWDVNGVNKEEENEEMPVVYTYRPHTRTITDLKFNPTDPTKLITTSYDGTVQYFDTEKATFGSMLDSQSYSYTNFDLTKDGHMVGILHTRERTNPFQAMVLYLRWRSWEVRFQNF